MPQEAVQIVNYNRLQNAFRRLAADMPEVSDEAVGQFAQAQRLALKAEPYPAKRPGQTYVRTGRLANSWGAVKEGEGRWTVINSQRYASYVVGVRQAWMHKGRWWIAREVIRRNAADLVATLTEMYEALARRVSR